jgi:hypothetical protein
MEDNKHNGVKSPKRREIIKLGALTGAGALLALSIPSTLEGATARPDTPVIVDGNSRWIQVSLPFPVEVDSDGEGHYLVYPDHRRPQINRIVITDHNGVEVFNWPVGPENWRIRFE